MKVLLCLLFVPLLFACKKDDNDQKEEIATEDRGPYPGRLSSYAGYPIYYNSDGLLTEYAYDDLQVAFQKRVVTLKWASDKMTLDRTGTAFGTVHAIYNRNAAGYCLESPDDIFNHWQYDSLFQVTTMNNVSYYWSNGNIDSLKYYGYTEIFEYSSAFETRNFGALYIPALPYLDQFRSKNLRTKTTRLNGARDTVVIKNYTYQFNAANRVIREIESDVQNDTVHAVFTSNYTYYE